MSEKVPMLRQGHPLDLTKFERKKEGIGIPITAFPTNITDQTFRMMVFQLHEGCRTGLRHHFRGSTAGSYYFSIPEYFL